MSVEVVFHGTGAGHPSADRGASCTSFRSGDTTVVVDAGEGATRAMMRDGIDLQSIDFLFLSHYHPDHWTGIPSLVMAWALTARHSPVTLFVPTGSAEFVERVLQYSWLGIRPMDYQLSIEEYEASDRLQAGSFELIPCATSHLKKYEAEGEIQGLAGPAYGVTLLCDTVKIHATQDIGSESDLEILVDDLDLLICEASHADPRSVIRMASDRKCRRIIFTHIPPDREELIGLVEAENKGKGSTEVIVAYDGRSITTLSS